MKKNINRLSVLSLLGTGLLAEAKEAGAGEGQELLETVLSVVVAAEGEEAAQQLVHRHRQAVDVVRVALNYSLGYQDYIKEMLQCNILWIQKGSIFDFF